MFVNTGPFPNRKTAYHNSSQRYKMSYSHINKTLSATGIGRWSCDRSGAGLLYLSANELRVHMVCVVQAAAFRHPQVSYEVQQLVSGIYSRNSKSRKYHKFTSKSGWLKQSFEILLYRPFSCTAFVQKKIKNKKKHQHIDIFFAT